MAVNVLCILQARMSSTRLPGKVLKPILGQPMLALQIERIRRAQGIDALVVATSEEASDEPIEALCRSLGVPCYRGSLSDVLDRYYQAAASWHPRNVMRLTGDCPLTDPGVLQQLVDLHLGGEYDYSSNVHDRTYPVGLDAELFRYPLLAQAWAEAQTPYEREHVTPYFYRTGPDFRRGALKDTVDRSALRWTVDYPEDFEFAQRVYEELYPGKPDFRAADIHALLAQKPEIAAINADRAHP